MKKKQEKTKIDKKKTRENKNRQKKTLRKIDFRCCTKLKEYDCSESFPLLLLLLTEWNSGAFSRERHAETHPPPLKSRQIEILAPKDAQWSETYAIFQFFNFFFVLKKNIILYVSGTLEI